jgi:hypothetical protein
MKDIIISSKRIKKELNTLIVCFLIGFIANVGAVFYYKTAVSEIFTSLHYVLIFGAVTYSLWSIIKTTILLIIKVIKKNKADN